MSVNAHRAFALAEQDDFVPKDNAVSSDPSEVESRAKRATPSTRVPLTDSVFTPSLMDQFGSASPLPQPSAEGEFGRASPLPDEEPVETASAHAALTANDANLGCGCATDR